MLVVAGFRFVVSGYAFSCIVTHCIYLSICGSCSGPVLSGTWLCIPVLCARRAPNSSFSANRFRIIFFRWTLHRDISQLGGWWWPPELCMLLPVRRVASNLGFQHGGSSRDICCVHYILLSVAGFNIHLGCMFYLLGVMSVVIF